MTAGMRKQLTSLCHSRNSLAITIIYTDSRLCAECFGERSSSVPLSACRPRIGPMPPATPPAPPKGLRRPAVPTMPWGPLSHSGSAAPKRHRRADGDELEARQAGCGEWRLVQLGLGCVRCPCLHVEDYAELVLAEPEPLDPGIEEELMCGGNLWRTAGADRDERAEPPGSVKVNAARNTTGHGISNAGLPASIAALAKQYLT